MRFGQDFEVWVFIYEIGDAVREFKTSSVYNIWAPVNPIIQGSGNILKLKFGQ